MMIRMIKIQVISVFKHHKAICEWRDVSVAHDLCLWSRSLLVVTIFTCIILSNGANQSEEESSVGLVCNV